MNKVLEEDWPKHIPKTLHGLLRLAVRDMEACSSDWRYKLDMAYWYKPGSDGCRVCMAGAVLVKSARRLLGCHVYDWMKAIDYLRCGRLEQALDKVLLTSLEREKAGAVRCSLSPYTKELRSISDIITSDPLLKKRGYVRFSTYIKVSDMLEELHYKHISDQRAERVDIYNE